MNVEIQIKIKSLINKEINKKFRFRSSFLPEFYNLHEDEVFKGFLVQWFNLKEIRNESGINSSFKHTDKLVCHI